jgi:GTP-binding protein
MRHERHRAPGIRNAAFAAAAHRAKELPAPVSVEIAFAGRSNVGKSSLLNRLMQRKGLARTSSTPGCTRAITFYTVTLAGGQELSFVDLPGYGYAKRSKAERQQWGELIDGYLTERPTLRALLLLVDVRRGLEADDLGALELVEKHSTPDRPRLDTVIIATKLDKLPLSARRAALAKLRQGGRRAVGFSTEIPETTADVWRALEPLITLPD